jgi:hypothetical protein
MEAAGSKLETVRPAPFQGTSRVGESLKKAAN